MAKSKNKTVYTCQNCGAQRPRWEGKCSDCGAWNSFVEELQLEEPKTRGWSTGSVEKTSTAPGAGKPVSLDQSLEAIKLDRFDTGFQELNRVLGGGLARGSFVLLGGSPGIGKSTLLLQMAGGLASDKRKILYISGEESVSQTGSRAHRLGIRSPLIEVGAESNLHNVMELARHKKPDVLVVDSIQTMYLSDLQAAPGSVSQVRECAGHLMGLAKQDGIAVILIGHVTKDGTIAGPKVLEHMVDCVLSFDGDTSYDFRLLRTLKNRFGAAHELGVFQMNSKGLEEVLNPSELFLEERGDQLIGSAVFASMEGTRPLLCEVQALTLSTNMAMPRRTSLGIDVNRLHLLTAVLDRHLDVRLSSNDIFVNVVGGLKLVEPAADLAVAAAILSTEGRRDLDAKTVFFGEIGLTGEVRGVSFVESRIKEADKLGFQHFVIPYSNKRHLADLKISGDKKISYIKNVKDLSRLI
ncbi:MULTISPECIES: DNA repair protein RadA [unclassified Bdellovibrio]|uniref:DNA repair protein RadA n=1 Tax=unclassified Bdellovibrio TaxID=2633795 RepID=UPI001156FBBA|nr:MULTISPECIES: DNA repair protein RadA [unclassified Bdellovibrio]QDK44802.1 DNA repair protein RadA [Bdellovibrio sp. ZAP7]QLY26537.1 DNA repair protein RadA [Bdellovibrio sp. KM01]